MSGATAEEFNKWEKDAKHRTIDELKFIVKDCAEAELAMRGWNAVKENYYADQRMTYGSELRKRLNKLNGV